MARPVSGSLSPLSRVVFGLVGLGLGHEGLGLLLVVEGPEDLVRLLALVPPDVVGVLGVFVVVAVGGVTVEDRAAESRAFDAVAVGAEGVVPAGQHPLKRLVGTGLAENGHAVVLEAAGVVFHLLHEPFVAVLAAEVLHDLLAEGLLLGGHVVDRRLDDVPVVADLLPQGMVEREADEFALFRAEASCRTARRPFRRPRKGSGRLGLPGRGRGPADQGNRPGEGAGGHRPDKVATRDGRANRAVRRRHFPVVDLCHGSRSPCIEFDFGEGLSTTDQRKDVSN